MVAESLLQRLGYHLWLANLAYVILSSNLKSANINNSKVNELSQKIACDLITFRSG
jgi:hypothetical protein